MVVDCTLKTLCGVLVCLFVSDTVENNTLLKERRYLSQLYPQSDFKICSFLRYCSLCFVSQIIDQALIHANLP